MRQWGVPAAPPRSGGEFRYSQKWPMRKKCRCHGGGGAHSPECRRARSCKRIGGLLGRLRPIDQIRRLAALLGGSSDKSDSGKPRCSLEDTAAAAERGAPNCAQRPCVRGSRCRSFYGTGIQDAQSAIPGMIRADRKVIVRAIVSCGNRLSEI